MMKIEVWRKTAGVLSSLILLLSSASALQAQEYDPSLVQLDTLKAAKITALKEKMRNTTQTGLMRLDSKKLAAGYAVFGTPDVVKTLQLMPGVAAGTELMSGLYVHGGDGADNLFLLDGVPLYNVSHFGGLFSSFNTDVIDNLDFYKSGFPARYGGRMSSVVDVSTREGDMQNYHGTASIGMIDGRLHFEGPIIKDKTSFNFGLRRSWMDLVVRPALAYANWKINRDEAKEDQQKVDGGYAMTDLNARITHRLSSTSTLNASIYYGNDYLLASTDYNKCEEDSESKYHYGNDIMEIGVRWGSFLATTSWDCIFSESLRGRVCAYYSQSHSDTGYDFSIWSWEDGNFVYSMKDHDISFVRDAALKADYDWFPIDNHHIRFGGIVQRHHYLSSRGYKQVSTLDGKKVDGSSSDMDSLVYRAWEPAVYIEDEIALLYNLTMNAGLRSALFTTKGKVWPTLEPRVAFKWLINNDYSVKLSYTRMAQFAHLVAAMYIDLPSNSWMPSTDSAPPMISDQIAGGLYTTPLENVTFNIEGWYKTMNHMLAYDGANSFYPPLIDWEKAFTEGRGRSWGSEMELSYDNGNLSLSAYYTLSWSQRKFDSYYDGWFLDRNDNRHKINLVGSYKFPSGLEFFWNWNGHSGNRITFPTHIVKTNGQSYGDYVYSKPYNAQLPFYHRLDCGFNFHKKTKKGRDWIANLSIYNAYNHLNAAFAFIDTDEKGNFEGTAFGLVPIIPTMSYTYKF